MSYTIKLSVRRSLGSALDWRQRLDLVYRYRIDGDKKKVNRHKADGKESGNEGERRAETKGKESNGTASIFRK